MRKGKKVRKRVRDGENGKRIMRERGRREGGERETEKKVGNRRMVRDRDEDSERQETHEA